MKPKRSHKQALFCSRALTLILAVFAGHGRAADGSGGHPITVSADEGGVSRCASAEDLFTCRVRSPPGPWGQEGQEACQEQSIRCPMTDVI
eukprot:368039-Pelagomonas_calceolata.AAC.1